MARYNGIETDQNGAIVPGAKIYVYDFAGENLATLTDDFGSSMQNPVVSDSLGAFYFNVVSEGFYVLKHLYATRYVRYEVIPVGTPVAAVYPSIANAGKYIALAADGSPTYASGTGADAALRTDIATNSGAALVGSNDGAGGTLWASMAGFVTYLRSSAGSSIVQFIQGGTGAIARTIKNKFGESVSVKDFGAVGDGATNDSAAIKAALNYAISFGYNKPLRVYFPAGRYLVTESNVLGQWNSIDTSIYKGVIGLCLYGDGFESSKIVVRNTGATAFYFWDNKQSAGVAKLNSLQFPIFKDLGFEGDNQSSGTIDGFRSYGTGNSYPSQGFRFLNCGFFSMQYPLRCEGVVNDSEMSFVGGRAIATAGLIYSENPQAVNFTVSGTDVEGYTSAAFYFVKGGQLTVRGGSFISFAATETFMFRCVPPDGIGTGTSYNFVNVRTELNHANAKLIEVGGTDNDSNIRFTTSQHVTRIGSAADCIKLGARGTWSLSFDQCSFSGNDGITWVNNGVANYWTNTNATPTLTFDSCSDIAKSNVTWQSNTLGYTRIGLRTGASWEGGTLGHVQGASPSSGAGIKSVIGWGTRWPNSSDSGAVSISAIVPVGSVILNVYCYKPIIGGSTATYRLQLVDGAGTEIVVPSWATGDPKSVSGQMMAVHAIRLEGLMKRVTDATTGTIGVKGFTAGDAATMPYSTAGCLLLVQYL